MRLLIRLIRIYTPFICTLAALLNGVYFIIGDYDGMFTYVSSAITGNSVLVIAYMFATSHRMCVWYKLNLLCLMLIQVLGLTYDCLGMDFTLYLWAVVLLASLGMVFFLAFRIFYRVTGAFLCIGRRSRK